MIVGRPLSRNQIVNRPVTAAKDVNFIDYDGMVLYSYTKDQFLNLTELPPNPSHTGLVSQGWNWTLSDAKAQVTTSGELEIGQMYLTSDGKTRIYIHLRGGRLSPYMTLLIDGSVTVDWGDGSTETLTGESLNALQTTQHTYQSAGKYLITLAVTGTLKIQGDLYSSSSTCGSGILWNQKAGFGNIGYQCSIERVEIGSNCVLGKAAFEWCRGMTSITLPSSITSISEYAFDTCTALRSLTIPNAVTGIGERGFYKCAGMRFVSLPKTVATIGSSAFRECTGMKKITIPSTVTQWAQYMLYNCSSLTRVTIPGTVTSIGSYALNLCDALTTITIPASVTSIGTAALQQVRGLGAVRFEGTTPPTLSGSALSISTDCVIYVPSGYKSTYTSASNYPSRNTYTYVEY